MTESICYGCQHRYSRMHPDQYHCGDCEPQLPMTIEPDYVTLEMFRDAGMKPIKVAQSDLL